MLRTLEMSGYVTQTFRDRNSEETAAARQKSGSDIEKAEVFVPMLEKEQQVTLLFLHTALNPDVYFYCSKGCLSPNALCIDA